MCRVGKGTNPFESANANPFSGRLTEVSMKHYIPVALVAFTLNFASAPSMSAQQEGALPTQALVNIDAKSTPPANASALTVLVDGRKQPLSSWTPVLPAQAQVALLIDDGLRESVGRELKNLHTFVESLPPGVEVLVGYMQNGHVVQPQPFTTDHALASSTLRLPQGIAGTSASPYFCLSDFVKKWPGSSSTPDLNAAPTISGGPSASGTQKARFVLMISNGVDPYNGSTSITNEDSPYVKTAITDSQRAGVAVYSIYYTDAGIGGQSASLSGQSYLQQLADGTGGVNYFEGTGNPVSMGPFLTQFQHAIVNTYIATFDAPTGKQAKDLVRVRFTPTTKTKLHAPDQVRPGNIE
jgi:hypothetical protein